MEQVPESLGLIAGKGVYPLLLAESARKQGVKHLFAVAFKGETDSSIAKLVDRVEWLHVGQLGALKRALQASGVKLVVMAGQITPTNLFRVRLDKDALLALSRLKTRNAHTIFNAVGEELKAIGVELTQASLFMEAAMPEPGVLTLRAPSAEEMDDVRLGFQVAKTTSGLEIGQTVVIKQGTILAVEAFEGTDATIRRAADLGGEGIVVVKVAKRGHDMRFDIPVVGERTLKLLRKTHAAVLAVEARRSILLERDKLIDQANQQDLSMIAFDGSEAGFGGNPAAL